MRVHVCDDSPEELRKLEFNLKKYSDEISLDFDIRFFQSGDEVLQCFSGSNPVPDLLFLDIYMHGISGDQVAKELRAKGVKSGIIFTTSSMEHAMASYEVNALYYLQKPYTYDNFRAAMERCHSIFDAVDQSYTISVHGHNVTLAHKDITFFETGNHNVIVHTPQNQYNFSSSIAKVARELAHKNSFLTCGRSYIINLDHVIDFCDGDLILDSQDIVTVPFRERERIRQVLLDRGIHTTL